MKLIFLLRSGVIEWSVPEDQRAAFNFNTTAVTFRMNGYFMANDLYLRHDEVIGMSIVSGETAAPVVRRDLN